MLREYILHVFSLTEYTFSEPSSVRVSPNNRLNLTYTSLVMATKNKA